MALNREAPDAYPSAPWYLAGKGWLGFFHTDTTVQLPDGIKPFLSRRWRIVVLVRYLAGTLQYDELIVGSPARRGLHPGLLVEHIWVNDVASREGGRHIWGLPKQLATFDWDGDTVHIRDEEGLIAALSLNQRPARLPPLWLPAPGIGRLAGHWTYFVARMWARLGRAELRLQQWSGRFGYRLDERPGLSLAAKPFRAVIPAPAGRSGNSNRG